MPLIQSTHIRPVLQPVLQPVLRLLRITLATLLLTSVPSIAFGAEDRSWFVVQNDAEPVRCMDQEIYYAVHEYALGTIIQSDGTSGDYTKVRYPSGFGAFVPVRDTQSINDGKRVRLVDDSQLAAASMLRGFDGSWCPVFAEPLKAGTELSVIEVMEDANDEVVGYRVLPPAPASDGTYAYIYIRTDALRPATASEIKEYLGTDPSADRPKLTAGPDQTNDEPSTKPAESEPAESEPVETDPVEMDNPVIALPEPDQTQSDPDPEQEPEQIDLREEMVIPETADPESTDLESTSTPPTDEPAVIENTIPKVIYTEKSGSSSTASPLTTAGLEALEASFTAARSMPRAQLDDALPELLAEFTRARTAAGDDESAARPLDQRIEWLNIRIQTRDQRRAIAQTLTSADEQSIELNSKIEQWNANRVYSLVGRLMISGVYTGEHLPLLYRVRAPDPVTGYERTIGYLAPTADQDLRRYLGRVIGVVGDPIHDDALSMTVLSPQKIELMPGQ